MITINRYAISMHPVMLPSHWAGSAAAITASQPCARVVTFPSKPPIPSSPDKAANKWVQPHPRLSGSDPGPHPTSPGSPTSLRSSLTRSSTTSQTTPSLYVVVQQLRGLLYHRAAVTSSDGSCSDPTTFPPGRPPSPIPRSVLPHIRAKCAYTSRLTHRYSSRSTCRTFPMSAISP